MYYFTTISSAVSNAKKFLGVSEFQSAYNYTTNNYDGFRNVSGMEVVENIVTHYLIKRMYKRLYPRYIQYNGPDVWCTLMHNIIPQVVDIYHSVYKWLYYEKMTGVFVVGKHSFLLDPLFRWMQFLSFWSLVGFSILDWVDDNVINPYDSDDDDDMWNENTEGG